MKVFQVITVILVLTLILGCSSVSIKTDYDRDYNFSEFKTYRWASGKEINPDDELSKYPLLLKRVQAAVDDELQSKGMTRVKEGEEPDVVILAHAGSKERMQVTQTGGYGGYGYWYDPWWGPYGGQTYVSYYEEATLVVDIVSWENKELAWRGMATGTVQEGQSAEKQEKRVKEVVARIFANYPPGTSAK